MEKQHPAVNSGLLALYGSIVLLALNGIFAKLIPLDAVTVSQARSVVACVALAALLLLQRRRFRLASWRQTLGVYALGVLLGWHWITYFHAMQISSVAIGMLALFSYPVITVALEPVFKKHLPRLADVAAALVVFLGVLIMVSRDIFSGEFSGAGFQGALFGVVSALLFSLRNTAQKYLFPQVDSLTLMAHQSLAVALMLLPFISITALQAMSYIDWFWLVILGCFSTATAHTLLSVALKQLAAKSVALISCAIPVVGSLLAWLILGETPQLMVYIGGAVILSVAAYETLKQQ